MIADAKRTHMHSGDNFQFSIVSRFCEQYKLLPYFAIALYNALFGNTNCPGAIPGLDNDEDDDSSDDEDSDKSTDGPNDPLIKRCAYVDEIVANLEGVLEKFKCKAQAALKL
ncbi:hypothetical protein LPJ54_006869 [Coemansia sp. RSA 1824]|nr:hypothetical protein LPJ54_006869 [Coemansia sp. RSA 1824]